jgi:hypothetical protein
VESEDAVLISIIIHLNVLPAGGGSQKYTIFTSNF